MKLPFKLLSRSRWERIRMALDAWPRLVDALTKQNRQLTAELDGYRNAMMATGGPPITRYAATPFGRLRLRD